MKAAVFQPLLEPGTMGVFGVADYEALLVRAFAAAGDPRSWEGFRDVSSELQELLISRHLKWAGFGPGGE